jgi:hypothetical protein
MEVIAPGSTTSLAPRFALDRSRCIATRDPIVPDYAEAIAPERVPYDFDTGTVADVDAGPVPLELVPLDFLVTARFYEYPEPGVPFHDIVLEPSMLHPDVGVNTVTTVVNYPVPTEDDMVTEDHVNAGAVPARIPSHYGSKVEIVVMHSVTYQLHAVRSNMYARLTVVMNVEIATDTVRSANNPYPST